MTVWIVFHGNYFPRELDSIRKTEKLAQARVDYLNNVHAYAGGCGYRCEEEEVREGRVEEPLI